MDENCGICQQPGGICVTALPRAQQQIVRGRSGQQSLPRVFGSYIRNLTTNAQPTPSPRTWFEKEAALWHAPHEPTTPIIGEPPIEQKFEHKGEKQKGDGVFRFQCAGFVVGDGEGVASEKKCPVWRRVSANPVTQLWTYVQSGDHKCASVDIGKKRMAPEVRAQLREQVMIRRRLSLSAPMNYVGIKRAMVNAQLPVPIPSTGTLRNYVHRAGDMAAVQPFNVLSLRTIVRAHSAVPEDEHQTFVVSNGDTIPDDGSFAAIAVSTPALLRNVSATHLHTG